MRRIVVARSRVPTPPGNDLAILIRRFDGRAGVRQPFGLAIPAEIRAGPDRASLNYFLTTADVDGRVPKFAFAATIWRMVSPASGENFGCKLNLRGFPYTRPDIEFSKIDKL